MNEALFPGVDNKRPPTVQTIAPLIHDLFPVALMAENIPPEKSTRVILLFGPETINSERAYGGGTGGYTRNMYQYANFSALGISVIPCTHTVRTRQSKLSFPRRFLTDMFRFGKSLFSIQPYAVHILAAYRSATPREYFVIMLSKVLGKKVVYDIKAGSFHKWYPKANRAHKAMMKYIINHVDVILCEGMPYVDFIFSEFGKGSLYYPNFMPDEEIPSVRNTMTSRGSLRVLFVGYVYEGKGVFEILKGCDEASSIVPIELTFVGAEHIDFKRHIENRDCPKGLKVIRRGKLAHKDIRDVYDSSDVFVYPTRHAGEGHSNVINEAMAFSLPIITTRQGFIGSVLTPESAYFLDTGMAEEIARVLIHISKNPDDAANRGAVGYHRLVENFTSSIAFRKLRAVYEEL